MIAVGQPDQECWGIPRNGKLEDSKKELLKGYLVVDKTARKILDGIAGGFPGINCWRFLSEGFLENSFEGNGQFLGKFYQEFLWEILQEFCMKICPDLICARNSSSSSFQWIVPRDPLRDFSSLLIGVASGDSSSTSQEFFLESHLEIA